MDPDSVLGSDSREMADLPKNVRSRISGGSRRYFATMDIRGRRVVEPLRDTIEEAELDAARLRLERRSAAPGGETLQEAWDALLDELRSRESSPSTVSYYMQQWAALTGEFGWSKDYPLMSITADQIRRYVEKRASTSKRRTTWLTDLQALRRIINHARRRRVLDRSPFSELTPPRDRGRRYHALPREEVLEVLAEIRRDDSQRKSDRDADLAELFFLTGLRRAEMARLRRADIDRSGRRLHVHGKTAERSLPLTDRVEALVDALESAAYRPALIAPGVKAIHHQFIRWRKRLHLPHWSPHVLRHSFATAAVRSGVSLPVLRELMGHTNIQQTSIYFHGSTDEHLEALHRIAGDHGARSSGDADRTA